ncbi:ABC transporter substrate-binding protein [Thermodesulfobacteriota bacterium]
MMKISRKIGIEVWFSIVIFIVLILSGTAGIAETSGPQYGGTLRIGLPTDALGLWPADIRSTRDQYIAHAALEPLARFDETLKLKPFLAEKWVEDPDSKTITVTLKKGIKFHDGTDFNAHAAKWNIEHYIKAKKIKAAESVDVVDNFTIRVNLSEWNNSALEPVLRTWHASPTAFNEHGKDKKWARLNPVGTGPFKFVSWKRDVKSVYEKFDGYWQEGKPYVDRLEYTIIADPLVAVASLKKGEIDVLIDVTPSDAVGLEKEGKLDIVQLKTGIGAGMYGFAGSSSIKGSPFVDIRVRRAITHAINVQPISNAVFKGKTVVTNQWGSPQIWSYNQAVVGYPYNPEKAKKLLAEAGYPNGFKTKIYTMSNPDVEAMVTGVQSQLKEVGIDAEIKVMNFGKFDTYAVKQGWPDGLIAMTMRAGPDIAYLSTVILVSPNAFLFSKSVIHPEENIAKYKEALAARDFETKQSLCWELQKLLIDKHCLFTPMFVWASLVAKYPYVHDGHFYEYDLVTYYPADVWIEK